MTCNMHCIDLHWHLHKKLVGVITLTKIDQMHIWMVICRLQLLRHLKRRRRRKRIGICRLAVASKKYILCSMPDQTRQDQTRPDQTKPDQTRPYQIRPDQFIQYSTKPKLLNVFTGDSQSTYANGSFSFSFSSVPKL